MNVDERLRDLRATTADRLHPSPGLRRRIEASVDAPRSSRWVMTLAVAAAAVVVLVVALASFRHDGGQRVVTRPPSREEFVAAANQRCLDYTSEHDKVVPVFATPEAFALAADNRIAIIQAAIADAKTVGAAPGANDVLAATLAQLRRGLDLAEQTRQLAAAGDPDGAAAAYQAEEEAVRQAALALADYGAQDCRPVGGP